MYVFQIITKTAVESFRRIFIVNCRNSVFIDSDLQTYDQSDNLVQNNSSPIVTTRARSTSKNLKQLCFICNEQRECDSNSNNNGVLGRCESEGWNTKLQERMTQFLDKKDKEHKFYEATTRP